MSTDVIGEALRELVLDRKTQDSKKRLFFCGHQAHEFSTAPVRYTQRRLMQAFTSSQPADLRSQRKHCRQKGIEPAKATTWITHQARQILFRI